MKLSSKCLKSILRAASGGRPVWGEARSLPPCVKVVGGERGTQERLERMELWWSNLDKMKEGMTTTRSD